MRTLTMNSLFLLSEVLKISLQIVSRSSLVLASNPLPPKAVAIC